MWVDTRHMNTQVHFEAPFFGGLTAGPARPTGSAGCARCGSGSGSGSGSTGLSARRWHRATTALILSNVTDFDAQAGRAVPDGDDLSYEQSESDEEDVLEAMRGLAGLVSTVEDIDEVLAEIAGYTLIAVPGADGAGAGVARASGTMPATVVAWAVTDPFVREIDHLQYDVCGEGPCLTAMQTQRVLTSGSLGSDQRWRRFGGRVARLNVHSSLAVPLLVRGDVVGALNIYARERDAFGEHAVLLTERFARSAAVTVGSVQVLHATRTKAAQLEAALTSRATIDQAIGILRSRSGGSANEAFDRLRKMSQSENVRVAAIAERLVDEAVRRAHARHSQT